MITSLNIIAKMFAKFAKMFIELSLTIVAIRRKFVLVLHLVEKYAKMDYKNEIYAKISVRSTRSTKSQT